MVVVQTAGHTDVLDTVSGPGLRRTLAWSGILGLLLHPYRRMRFRVEDVRAQ